MQQLEKAGYSAHSAQPEVASDNRVVGKGFNNDISEHSHTNTYDGIQVGDNARAHFGDQYHHNHGILINANNLDLNEHTLQQLARLDLRSSSARKTFGLCLGQAPQIEYDAFIGRHAELQQLQEWFIQDAKAQIVSIIGMGGLGKTQLSLAYARKHRDRYTSLFWVNAKDELSLRQSLSTLARVISADATTQGSDTNKEQTQVELVLRWLSEEWNDQWFLIFDNYDDPNLPNTRSTTGFDIRSYFPHRAQGHILITTRSPKLTFSKRLMLQKLDDIDLSLAVLKQRSGRDLSTDVDATRLAIRLDGLPLALATAGVYLGETNVSCTEYLQAYESTWTDLYGPDSEELLEYEDRTLSSTWVISFNQVSKVDADAAELFKLWAYFSNKDIWYELIRTGEIEEPAWISRITANKIRFDRAMTKLKDYSLVEVTAGSYSIHTCVHTWISECFEADITMFLAALKCVTSNIPEQSSTEYWTTTRRLLSHVNRLLEPRFQQSWESAMYHRELIHYNNVLGKLFLSWGHLDQAEKMCTRAVVGYEQMLGHDHLLTLDAVHSLGQLYTNQNLLDEAETMFQRALVGYEKAVTPDLTSTLRVVNNIGNLYAKQGKLEQAEEMYKRALKGWETTSGPDHMLMLSVVNNLGNLYANQGDLEQAETMYKRALEGHEQALGRDHLSTLHQVDNLGFLYRDQGKLDQAEEMHKRALAARQKTLGLDHGSTLDTLNDLGTLYHKQGRLKEADETFSQLLSTYPGSDTEGRWEEAIHELVEVLAKSIKAGIDGPQGSQHRMARIVRHVENPGYIIRPSIPYLLGRALFWMNDEENALIAFAHRPSAICNGCEADLNLPVGHHVCRQCDDADLCNDCMAKYGTDGLTLSDCNGHEYFDAGSAVAKSQGSLGKLNNEDMDRWIEKLKEKYPIVAKH